MGDEVKDVGNLIELGRVTGIMFPGSGRGGDGAGRGLNVEGGI